MPIEFVALQCPKCDGQRFVPVLFLKYRPGGGLVEEKCGWECTGCRQRLDANAALQAQAIRDKREELRQLEHELGIEKPLEVERG